MRVHLKRFKESFIEGTLFISSTVTTLTVLLIIFFLFSESFGLFKMTPVEEGFTLLTNKANPVKELKTEQIKLVFDQEITNWKQIGGKDEDIELFRIDDIGNYYTEEELGASFEYMPEKIEDYITKHTGIVAFIPDKYIKPAIAANSLQVDKIELKKVLMAKEWFPTSQPAAQLGVLPLIAGTFLVSIGAILLALPFGLAAAIYLAEIAQPRIRNFLKPTIELLAGIPSVVYGFFGLVVIVPFIQKLFNLPVGEKVFV